MKTLVVKTHDDADWRRARHAQLDRAQAKHTEEDEYDMATLKRDMAAASALRNRGLTALEKAGALGIRQNVQRAIASYKDRQREGDRELSPLAVHGTH